MKFTRWVNEVKPIAIALGLVLVVRTVVAEPYRVPSPSMVPTLLTGDELISDVGNWDSLSVISFVAMVDSDMDQIVDGEQLKGAKTLNDLAALVGL